MPFNIFSTLFGTQRQITHDIFMYDKQRKDYLEDRKYSEMYNSPEAQVQRLRDAGLNPGLAMNNIQTGSVNGSTNPNASPSNVAQSGQNLTQGILSLMGYKNQQALVEAQTRNISADAKLKEINALTQYADNIAQINKLRGEGRESWKRGDHIDSIETARYNDFLSQIGERASSAELKWAQHAVTMEQLKYLPIDKSLGWIEQVGRIMESAARTEVSKRQAEKLIEEATAAHFGWKDKKFQYELNKKTEQFLIRQRRLTGVPKNPYEFIGAGTQELYDLF